MVLERVYEIPNPDVRKLAKAVADEMQNRGVGLSLEEARQVALAESEVPYKFYDESGHEVDPAAPACEACGSKRASMDAPYSCAVCGSPVDPRSPQCEKCGGRQAIPTELLSAKYECERCGLPILDPESTPRCPNCNHQRAIEKADLQ